MKLRKIMTAVLATGAIAVSSAFCGAQANLLTNGSFETGDFTGWTVNDSTNWTEVVTGGESGNYYAALGSELTAPPYGTIAQSVTTNAGQSYSLSYWFESFGGTPNYFGASWDGNIIAGSVIQNSSTVGWTEYQFNVTGTGSDTLTFDTQNVPSFSGLDNVSVSAVPLPASFGLFGFGVAALGVVGRRRKA